MARATDEPTLCQGVPEQRHPVAAAGPEHLACSGDEAVDLGAIERAWFELTGRAVGGDRALPLRLVASLHRRAVHLDELHLVASPAGPESDGRPRVSFAARFTASGRQALTVLHTARAVQGVEEVELTVECG